MTGGFSDTYNRGTFGNMPVLAYRIDATHPWTGFRSGYMLVKINCDFPVNQGANIYPDSLQVWMWINVEDFTVKTGTSSTPIFTPPATLIVDTVPMLPIPDPVTNLQVAYSFKQPSSAPILMWNNVQGATSYVVSRFAKRGNMEIELGKVTVSSSPFVDFTLHAAILAFPNAAWQSKKGVTKARYEVVSRNPAGDSAPAKLKPFRL
jgi:hypothetical protein